MAKLPPRKTKVVPFENNNNCKPTITPLQTLLREGFAQNREENALAAIANGDVQSVIDGAVAHINDVTLNARTSYREYIIYVCPSGPFLKELTEFWDISAKTCGRNGVHNLMPHITLTPFFKMPDTYSDNLVSILKNVLDEVLKVIKVKDFHLRKYASSTYMGFFLSDYESYLLKKIAVMCAERIKDLAKVQINLNLKSFHLTLAYQFNRNHRETLKSLISSTIKSTDYLWELNLYSRKETAASHQVYKVIYARVPQTADELELRVGDYIHVSEKNVNNSTDGWVDGTSWLTECNGCFPLTFTERTAESDTWTLHCSLPLNGKYQESIGVDDTSATEKRSILSRKIYICCHGESVDFSYDTWVPYSFASDGKYMSKYLDMPQNIPQRYDFPNSYETDAHLTSLGEHQAKLIGLSMKAAHLTKSIKHVYCSPSLRCVQTCHNILVGLGIEKQVSICVEPGIFEWFGWYNQSVLPDLMNNDEFIDAGFNINSKYEALIPLSQLSNSSTETVEQYHVRCEEVVQNLIKTTELKGGDILLVGHACSLVSLSSSLLHKSPQTKQNFIKMVKEIPYCGLVTLMNNSLDSGLDNWDFKDPSVPPLTTYNNKTYNWKFLFFQ